jgi:hypothetical protein
LGKLQAGAIKVPLAGISLENPRASQFEEAQWQNGSRKACRATSLLGLNPEPKDFPRRNSFGLCGNEFLFSRCFLKSAARHWGKAGVFLIHFH